MGRGKGPVLLREDISDLQIAFDTNDNSLDEAGKKQKLAMQKLLWAFHVIQNIDTNERDSFFRIAGFHGMPFRGAGWGNPSWWGGYCNHGSVLFPTWHRAYLVRLENALRAVTGYDDITIPYWNETGSSARLHGIPTIFLRKNVTIPRSVARESGVGNITIANPLFSYKFQDGIWDNLNPIPDADYSKPKGYETTRYPFSGLASSEDAGAAKQHNKFVAMLDTDKLLNENVTNWLSHSIENSDGKVIQTNTYYKYLKCLDAPNYTVFSNTTSATQYNEDIYYNTPGNDVSPQTVPPKKPRLPVVPLESPHNDMHLAIGGFDIPGQGNFDSIIGANGDMGENDTAAFDPIFFFHHCFIDKVFWDWQRKWHARTRLTIEEGYPGTNSVDYQGPTPGVSGNTWLTMESPLAPFTMDDTEHGKALVSNDVVDIVRQLSYKYYSDDDAGRGNGGYGGGYGGGDGGGDGGDGGCHGHCCQKCQCKCGLGKTCGCGCQTCQPCHHLSNEISWLLTLPLPGREKSSPQQFSPPPPPPQPQPPAGDEEPSVHVVRVAGVNRAALAGSFALVVRAVVNGKDSIVGTESVLSRWKVSGCANCQQHLGVKAYVPLVGLDSDALSTVRVGLHARGKTVDDINTDRGIGGGWRLGNMEMPHGMNF
ncbi:tyrosinase [Xylariaceae sp. AK1471]|nr:tyrosinase [Xylariaceae sp. AK1471]